MESAILAGAAAQVDLPLSGDGKLPQMLQLFGADSSGENIQRPQFDGQACFKELFE